MLSDYLFIFPLELLSRKSESKTQTLKLQAAGQSLLSDCEHWKASHLGQQQPCFEPHVLIHVGELRPALQLSLER